VFLSLSRIDGCFFLESFLISIYLPYLVLAGLLLFYFCVFWGVALVFEFYLFFGYPLTFLSTGGDIDF
jgi:hypothetical protein